MADSLVWDATCTNTFNSSYVTDCAVAPGATAHAAEHRKRTCYTALTQRYHLEPLAVETTGLLGPAISSLLTELGHHITAQTREKRGTCWRQPYCHSWQHCRHHYPSSGALLHTLSLSLVLETHPPHTLLQTFTSKVLHVTAVCGKAGAAAFRLRDAQIYY